MTAMNILRTIGRVVLYLPRIHLASYLQVWRTRTGEMIIVTFLMELGDAMIVVVNQEDADLIIGSSLLLIILGLVLWVMVNAVISGYRQGKTIESLSNYSRGISVHLGLLLLLSRYFWGPLALT